MKRAESKVAGRKEFLALAREHTLVPVVRRLTADLETPVSAFLRLAWDEPECFLLESVENGQQVPSVVIALRLEQALAERLGEMDWHWLFRLSRRSLRGRRRASPPSRGPRRLREAKPPRGSGQG